MLVETSKIAVERAALQLHYVRVMATSSEDSKEYFETLDTDQLDRVGGGYSAALFGAMQHAVGMGLTVNSTVTGGHATHSYHYLGRAFDAIGTESQMQGYFNWAKGNLNTTELIHRNQFLKNGKPVAPIGGHDGHVHTAI